MKESSVSWWAKRVVGQYWQSLLVIVLFNLVVAGAWAAVPLLWQKVIDAATKGQIEYGILGILSGLMVVGIQPFPLWVRMRFLNRYAFKARHELFAHALGLSIPFHREKDSTSIILEANRGIEAAMSLLSIPLRGNILVNIPLAAFSLGYIARHNIAAAAVLVLFVVVFLLSSFLVGKRTAKAEEQRNEQDIAMAIREGEVLRHIEAVRSHGAEGSEVAWHTERSKELLRLDDRRAIYYAWFNFLGGAASTLPFLVVAVFFLPDLGSGAITFGTLAALFMFSDHVVAPLVFLGDMYQTLQTSKAKIKPLLHLLHMRPTVVEAENPVSVETLREGIVLRGVSFSYPDAIGEVVRGISLAISRGEKVAIVGRSGCGKTTIVRLLARFYDPGKGSILIDGIDLRQLGSMSLRRLMAVVSQDVPIFSGTIRDNVAYGLSCTDQEIELACRRAAADFIFQQELGLDTQVGEQGEKLSGGQRQRIALARIFLRKPSVVILDEATSALDRLTEREVQSAIDQLLQMNGGTTMIVIAHRIATVRNADRIVVVADGRIADIGPHEELLRRCALYQELCHEMAE